MNGAPWWLQLALTAVGGWAIGAATSNLLMARRVQKMEQTLYGDLAGVPSIAQRLETISVELQWVAGCVMSVAVHSGLHTLPPRPTS